MAGRNRFRKGTDMGQQLRDTQLRSVALPEEPADLGELLSLVARGDELAFGAVYDQMGAAVFGLARRVIRDPARAEEIALCRGRVGAGREPGHHQDQDA